MLWWPTCKYGWAMQGQGSVQVADVNVQRQRRVGGAIKGRMSLHVAEALGRRIGGRDLT